ncbi:MAG: hypothetical protein ACTHLO_14175 [Pseudolabrys sp.]
MTAPQAPIDPQADAAIARVKKLMLIASLTTVVAVGAVFGVIGYRVFRSGESAGPPPGEAAASLPAGAKVLSSAVGDGRVVLTVEAGGAVELYSFDLKTLRPRGHLRIETKP